MRIFEAKQHKLLDFNKPNIIFHSTKMEMDFTSSFDLIESCFVVDQHWGEVGLDFND